MSTCWLEPLFAKVKLFCCPLLCGGRVMFSDLQIVYCILPDSATFYCSISFWIFLLIKYTPNPPHLKTSTDKSYKQEMIDQHCLRGSSNKFWQWSHILETVIVIRFLWPIACGHWCCLFMFGILIIYHNITTWSYAIQIWRQHCESPWPRKIAFFTNLCWGYSYIKMQASFSLLTLSCSDISPAMNVNLWEQLILQFYFDILWETSSGLQFFSSLMQSFPYLKLLKSNWYKCCFSYKYQHTALWLVCWFCCFTSQVNSYGHCRRVSSPNHTFSWAGLNKRLTSNLCAYFCL